MNQSNTSVKYEYVPLAVVGEDHGVLHRLDHDELLGLEEVGLERRGHVVRVPVTMNRQSNAWQ